MSMYPTKPYEAWVFMRQRNPWEDHKDFVKEVLREFVDNAIEYGQGGDVLSYLDELLRNVRDEYALEVSGP